jgi:hypothetical protein
MAITIFDLDGTVICSKHRQNTLPDGSLDLAAWKANNTPEKIMADSLLPLADHWRWLLANTRQHIIVCTARVVQAADFEFLKSHGLKFNRFLARMGEKDTRRDSELKVWHFQNLGIDFRKVPHVFYDDNDGVREAVGELGINAIHPRDFK